MNQSPTKQQQTHPHHQQQQHQQQAAPIRCFFDDIPNVVGSHQQQQQQHHQQQQQESSIEPIVTAISDTTIEESWNEKRSICNTNANHHDPSLHPITKRRKIIVEKDYIQPPSTLWLRLLGTVVHVSSPSCDTNNAVSTPLLNSNHMEQQNSNYHTYDQSITLDDGTGMIVVYVTLAMIQQIRIQNGMIIDCIVRVEMQPNLNYNSSNHNHQTVSLMENIRFIANQITIQDSTKETLRWLELSYQSSMIMSKNQNHNYNKTNHTEDWDMKLTPELTSSSSSLISSSPTTTTASTTTTTLKYHLPQSSKWMGYPTRDVSAEDIYRIIASECETYSDEIYITAQNYNDPNNNNPKSGVSIQDLTDCFQSDITYITTLVQELQHSGQIYQNENGLYTLL
jgi:hypothetical protein